MFRNRDRARSAKLTRERDQARERAGEARERAAELRGRMAGERAAAQVIAAQLAQHAAHVGGELAAARMTGQRAVTDMVACRRLVAEHVDALRAGVDAELAAMVLVDQLVVRGVSIRAELAWVAADRAQREAQASAGESAAAAAVPAEAS